MTFDRHGFGASNDSIPPPPDGGVPVPIAAWHGAPADPSIPPPPDGGVPVPVRQGDGGVETQVGFPDTLPPQAKSRMSPEDDAHIHALLNARQYGEAVKYAGRLGFDLSNVVKIQRSMEHGGGPVPADSLYQLPRIETTSGGAFARGAEQGATLGFGDELTGLAHGVASAAQGNGFSDAYDRSMDASHANLAADDEQHWISSLAGNLLGSLALPVGLEKAGLTTSVRMVGAAARDAAIAEGMAPTAADRIAARAIAHRLAAEGAAYGGAYGTGTSDSSPGQRLVGAVSGAAGGALLGGVAIPAVGRVLGAARNGIGRAYDALTGSYTKAGAERAASGILSDAAMRPVEDIVNEIANRPQAVDGVAPTLAEVAGDSGIAGLQRGVANTSKTASGPIGERMAQNAIARTAYADASLGGGNPQAVQDLAASRVSAAEQATAQQQAERAATAEQRIANLQRGAASDRALADQGVADASAAIGPTADRTATGSEARDAFGSAYDAARARTREAYGQPVLQNPQPVNIPKAVFQGIINTAHDFYGDGGGVMPESMQSIISDLADDPANTRTLTNIDRRLADVAGAAQVQGKRSEAAFANRVRATLDSYVQENAPQDYRDALAKAKSVRAEQGQVFETGDAPKAFAKDKFGNPVVGDTTVPTRLVRPGAPGGDTADGLIAAIGPEAAENTVRQELRRKIEEGGITTEAQARSLATKFGEVAKRFPAVRADLDALIGHTGRLDAAVSAARDADRATVTTAEKAHINELSAAEQAIKASPISRIADPAQDPASFVAGLLRRSDGGRMLARLASDVADNPEAVAGLRRSFGQYIVEAGSGVRNTASGDDIPALAKTRKAISTITTRAGDLLTPQQKIALQRVGRELKAVNFAMNAGRPSGSDTAQNQSYKAALHFFPMVVPHAAGAKAVLSVLTAHLTNRAQVQHLITQAILDPDFAATLLKRPTQMHLDAARTRLLGRKALISSSLIAQPMVQAEVQQRVGTR